MATIRIDIADSGELFGAPEYDPLKGKFERRPGVDRIVDALEATPRRANTEGVEIALPAPKDGEQQAIGAALASYCDFEIASLEGQLSSMRRHGVNTLRIGLLVLAACLGLSTAATTMLGTGVLGNVLSNSFVIAGWVALWRPAEILLYDWWPLRHRTRLLERLREAPLRVVQSSR